MENNENLRDWFDRMLWALKPNGHSPEHTYQTFLEVIQKEKNNKTGKLITKEFILEKFSAYIAYKDSLGNNVHFAERKVESLYHFLSNKMWEETFKVQVQHNPTRDNYLFGIDY